MIIKQPDDKSIDKERINGMLILLNELCWNSFMGIESRKELLEATNQIPMLHGKFIVTAEDGVVFEAGNF